MYFSQIFSCQQEVLVDAIDGEKLNRNIPLQRQKTSELAFVLRAIATVVASMKRAEASGVGANPGQSSGSSSSSGSDTRPGQIVDRKTWQQAIDLYPYLVQCTETSSAQVGTSVKEALLQYHDLLQPMGGGRR